MPPTEGGGMEINMKLDKSINKLKELSDFFCKNDIEDIYTNSKIYEVLIAYQLGHKIINGHAHTLDAIDQDGNTCEYKHYKKSSSNHTWTFNDYTDETIQNLHKVNSVYFVVIDDRAAIPKLKKIYVVSGKEVAKYLTRKKPSIKNHRKMMNISERKIVDNMSYKLLDKGEIKSLNPTRESLYYTKLKEVFTTAREIEEEIKVNGILTSNKLWELLVACNLGHRINSEQKKHDAYDADDRTYEYKVSKKSTWTFQDISNNVLKSYLNDERIILAVVNKKTFVIKSIAACQPKAIVRILRKKLKEKKLKEKKRKSKKIRRLTANIGMKDINQMLEAGDAEWIL